VERRIYAAEGVPEEICPAPFLMCSQTHSVQTLSLVPYVLSSLLEKWPSNLNQRKPTAEFR